MRRRARTWRFVQLTQNILVPTDFSKASELALAAARILALQNESRLTLAHVLAVEPLHDGDVEQPLEATRELEDAVRDHLSRIRTEALGDVPDVKQVLIRGANAANAICEFAEEGDVDMIVIATHGRTGLVRFLIGSVAEKIVRHAPCPVLVLRSKAKD